MHLIAYVSPGSSEPSTDMLSFDESATPTEVDDDGWVMMVVDDRSVVRTINAGHIWHQCGISAITHMWLCNTSAGHLGPFTLVGRCHNHMLCNISDAGVFGHGTLTVRKAPSASCANCKYM